MDNTTNPESLTLELPATGTYFVLVDSFTEDQSGDFLYRVSEVEVAEQVLSDYNLLFFLEDGTFIGAFSEQNLFSNRPLEGGGLPEATLQMVIARANVPPKNNRNVADRIRYVGFSGIRPQEHFSYLSPVTYGHNSARGAIGVAAYPFFRPFIPEFFTSPGPSTIYFNRNNRRLGKPDVREKPDLAAMDGANTTFFFEDALEDEDTLPNFFGTSARRRTPRPSERWCCRPPAGRAASSPTACGASCSRAPSRTTSTRTTRRARWPRARGCS